MIFSPRRSDHLKKLSDAAKASYKQLEPFRSERLKALRQFVGKHYGNEGAEDKVPLNFIGMATRTYVRKLVGRRPRVRCETRFRELEQYASELKDAINETIQEIDLASTLEEVVINALFGMGIAKIGITVNPENALGYFHDTGEPFVDSVDLTDWVHDMNAKRPEAWQFCGNRYELDRETVLANPNYDAAAKNRVHAKSKDTGLAGFGGNTRFDPHDIEQGQSKEDNTIYDMVELWDYWLPKEGIIITCTDECEDKPLQIVEWNGPESGPYRRLCYCKVPNSVMPLPPAMDWMDLHELINSLARKVGRQADRQKTVTMVAPSSEADGQRVIKANDGDMVPVNDPNMIKEIRFGGADAPTVALLEQMRSHANYHAGNIEAMSGLGPQSGTVGQDQLLHASASEVMLEMQEKTERFVSEVCGDIGYWMFTDPTGVKQISQQVESLGMELPPVYWGPDRRVGKYYQYNISVVPYSLRPQSPEQKLMSLNGLIDRFGPMMQIMLAQGWTIDFGRLIQLSATLADMPELQQVLVPADPQMAQQMGGQQEGPKMPRSTTREYVRRDSAGQKESPASQFLQIAGSQPAQT